MSHGRFANIKFNLQRAIELLGDLNHHDMDISAPPSGIDFDKEYEVATRLNDYLTQLIEEGVFDDCEAREPDGSDEESSYGPGSQESEGFDYEQEPEQASKESFTGRFRRYVQRMRERLPGGGGRSGRQTDEEPEASETEEDDYDGYDNVDGSSLGEGSRRSGRERSLSGSRRSDSTSQSLFSSGSRRLGHQSRSRSRRSQEPETSGRHSSADSHREHSRERSGSEPYDPNVVYEHRHQHKHNHPGPHHHHAHSGHHSHTYHTHTNEALPVGQTSEDGEEYEDSVGGISDVFRNTEGESGEEESELSSNPLGSRRSSLARSASSGRRSRSNRSGRSNRSSRSNRSNRSRKSRGRSSSRASRASR